MFEKEYADDVEFLLSLVPQTIRSRSEIVKGLDPTFYFTLRCEEDMKLAERVEKIEARLNDVKTAITWQEESNL